MAILASTRARKLAFASAMILGVALTVSSIVSHAHVGCERSSPNCRATLGVNASDIQSSRSTNQASESADSAQCQKTFFSQDVFERLSQQFGILRCFRMPGSDQWVVIGNGMSLASKAAPPPPSIGGAMIAIESCGQDEVVSCSNPATEHDFRRFIVSYPPSPSSGRLDFLDLVGTHLIQVINAYCGPFTFDTHTLHWYVTSVATVQALSLGRAALLDPVPVPAPVVGALALRSHAPSPIRRSCPATTSQ